MNKLSLCQKFNVVCLCPLRFNSREEEEEEAKVRKLSLHITVASTRVSKTPSFYCLLKYQLIFVFISFYLASLAVFKLTPFLKVFTHYQLATSLHCFLIFRRRLQLAECVISRRRQGEPMSQKAMVPAGTGNRNGGQLYPQPLASHENIVNDQNLFRECLKNFHSVMGTKYT